MGKYFSAVCCGDEVTHPKPDGRHIKSTMAKFRTLTKLVIMVGDTENDIIAAKRAGIPSIYVTFWYNIISNLEASATAFITNFSDFPEVVNTISNQYSSMTVLFSWFTSLITENIPDIKLERVYLFGEIFTFFVYECIHGES